MTKRNLIEEVAERYPRFSRREVEVMVNAVFDSMTQALVQGERIEIRGFGSFLTKARPAREGRNPRTGAAVSVAAKRVLLFKVGKELRLRVNKKTAIQTTAFTDGTPPRPEQGPQTASAQER